jgi:hypothetical protein
VPPGFEYNAHYAIVILGSSEYVDATPGGQEPEPWQLLYEPGQEQQPLPAYFAPSNDEVKEDDGKAGQGSGEAAGATGTGREGTFKRTILELRLFNYRDHEVTFRVGIYLFHGLFRPYLDYLANKVSIEFFRANRQLMGTDRTYGILISEA